MKCQTDSICHEGSKPGRTMLILLLLIITLNTWIAANEAQYDITVTVTDAVVTTQGVLQCKWEIRNNGERKIHLYASCLRGSIDGDLVEEITDQNVVLLPSTWMTKRSSCPGYSFPVPEFIDLDPGAKASGSMKRKLLHPISRNIHYIKLVVGVCSDIKGFDADWNATMKRGLESQVNPIVRWQTLVFSSATALAWQ